MPTMCNSLSLYIYIYIYINEYIYIYIHLSPCHMSTVVGPMGGINGYSPWPIELSAIASGAL